jgi:hypothetical protein
VLDRLQTFLPEMQRSNAELQRAVQEGRREDYDIEAVGLDEAHVEMARTLAPHRRWGYVYSAQNLALGVFDTQPRPPEAAVAITPPDPPASQRPAIQELG